MHYYTLSVDLRSLGVALLGSLLRGFTRGCSQDTSQVGSLIQRLDWERRNWLIMWISHNSLSCGSLQYSILSTTVYKSGKLPSLLARWSYHLIQPKNGNEFPTHLVNFVGYKQVTGSVYAQMNRISQGVSTRRQRPWRVMSTICPHKYCNQPLNYLVSLASSIYQALF